jgi:hypothetical protein
LRRYKQEHVNDLLLPPDKVKSPPKLEIKKDAKVGRCRFTPG